MLLCSYLILSVTTCLALFQEDVCTKDSLDAECISTFMNQEINIATPLGKIKGKIVSVAGTTNLAAQFLGIPYAEPPIRFQDSIIKAAWSGVLEALSYGDSCMQMQRADSSLNPTWFKSFHPPGNMSEDCLFLNIWTPYPLPMKASVMVWIHGGAFYFGHGAVPWSEGKTLAVHNNVIVVSINYRLGAFGFLASGDNRIKGNFGLKDQILALKWIQENIAVFGGDPNSVTLFGVSAGAASVGLHLLSPLSQNLFKRGILQSGSPVSLWAYMTPEIVQSRFSKFIQNVNCPDDDKLLDCLSLISSEAILSKQFYQDGFIMPSWCPVIDGEFLPDAPLYLLKSGQLKKANILLGITKDEATLLLLQFSKLSADEVNKKSQEEYFNLIDRLGHAYPQEIREVLRFLYYDWKNSSDSNNYKYLNEYFSDRFFTCPAIQFSHYANEFGNDIFLYHLTYRSSVESWPEWMGVIHLADIYWIFGMPLNRTLGYSDEERKLSVTVMKYWSNFAKYGDPVHKRLSPGLPAWPKYRKSHSNYLQISSCSKFPVETSLRTKYCVFWNDVLSNLLNSLNQAEI